MTFIAIIAQLFFISQISSFQYSPSSGFKASFRSPQLKMVATEMISTSAQRVPVSISKTTSTVPLRSITDETFEEEVLLQVSLSFLITSCN